MATTTNYGWTTPDDTALVKDGAAAIRTLGSSADTTVKNLNPGTTAGDIDYYTSGTAKARIGIGTAGQILAVNSGATAPEWVAAPTGGGETLITSGTLSGASVTISSIPTTYNDLKLVIRNFLPASTANIRARFNGDSANRYTSLDGFTADTNISMSGDQMQLTSNQNSTSSNSLIVSNMLDYANTTTWKQIFTFAITNNSTTVANLNFFPSKGYYNQNSAITSLTLFPNTGNFTSGDYFLYGVK